MKAIIITLIVIGSIVALMLIVALFVKKDYVITREVIIDRPKTDVFDYIRYIGNSENYSKWVMADPNSKKERRGVDGEVGFVYAWDSQDKNVGAGEQEITSIKDGEEIVFALRFIRPFEGKATATMKTIDVEGSTKVTWTFKNGMKYPLNIMGLFMDFEKMLGGDMEISLQNLKVLLEKTKTGQ